MLVSELVERVRYRIVDTQNIGYKTPELLDYINEGHKFLRRTVSKHAPLMLSTAETGFTEPGVATSNLSLKAVKILELRINGKKITKVDLDSVQDLTSTGVPSKYFLPNFIHWVPIPDGRYPFIAVYIPEAQRLLEKFDSGWPSDYEDFIVEYATIRAGMRNEFSVNVEEQFMAIFGEQIKDLLNNMTTDFTLVKGYF
ncbi:hypothetical protein [Acetonema longum]|uniref:Uncharacterized protein n=1 Tax=Acetonema longum DSM 6540 TaxID=1009370 RepID=F7NK54_9FIRM|nr:hypothetical protein [Acetonema longum]EGO63495.1 hypothetical protein ALO_12336 [Acetonema longum DSM 6540]